MIDNTHKVAVICNNETEFTIYVEQIKKRKLLPQNKNYEYIKIIHPESPPKGDYCALFLNEPK